MHWLELAGEDDAFAAREAESAAAVVDVVAPGVGLARGLDLARVEGLAYTHRANRFVGRTDASVRSARVLLEAAALDVEGTVAVRARDVRRTADVDSETAERELGQVLVDRGFEVDLDDPDHELHALFAAGETPDGDRGDVCALGWAEAASVRNFGERKPTERPFFQPGSMDPLDARALANVAGAGPGATVLDPMCGTGGVLVEAGLVGARAVGVDAQAKMVAGARENCAAYLDGDFAVCRGDATRLPVADDAVTGVVFDAPYGRQSKVERHSLRDLVGGALAEARRVAPRAVVVGDRSWRGAAVDAGWRVESLFERPVHRSLTRYVHVLADPSTEPGPGRKP